jgi:hypothetical protein
MSDKKAKRFRIPWRTKAAAADDDRDGGDERGAKQRQEGRTLSTLTDYQQINKMDAASFLGTLAFALAYYKVREEGACVLTRPRVTTRLCRSF